MVRRGGLPEFWEFENVFRASEWGPGNVSIAAATHLLVFEMNVHANSDNV